MKFSFIRKNRHNDDDYTIDVVASAECHLQKCGKTERSETDEIVWYF